MILVIHVIMVHEIRLFTNVCFLGLSPLIIYRKCKHENKKRKRITITENDRKILKF